MKRKVSAGRAGHRWRILSAEVRARRDPCWLCGQPIDYTLPWRDPRSFSVDHVHPLSTHPHHAEDPASLRAAHRRCNTSRGTRDPKPSIGQTSRQW